MEEFERRSANGQLSGDHRLTSIGLITGQTQAGVLETLINQVDSFLTSNELFYILSHSPAPKLTAESYRLQIDGAVRNPISLTFKQLRNMPAMTRAVLLECVALCCFRRPEEPGAVGTAEWIGVCLSDLLEKAGLDDDACEIVLEGPDRVRPEEPMAAMSLITYCLLK
jgi:DMSO/TMAO reductase YedYZ molybdopterin-dependent catalytic subunit